MMGPVGKVHEGFGSAIIVVDVVDNGEELTDRV